MAVAVCAAATATPTLVPACARCAGCVVDLSQCATPSTTTIPGATTTTTAPGLTSTTTATTAPGATATTTTLACETAGCLLDAGLLGGACGGEAVPAHITRALDHVLHLIDEAHVQLAAEGEAAAPAGETPARPRRARRQEGSQGKEAEADLRLRGRHRACR